MSACFQKQVGKRKKTEDEYDLDLNTASSKADETVISDDSNGSGRSDRLTKRRKREEEFDDKFENAKCFLQKEFGIEVDNSMSRREVIELAASCLSSKNDQPTSKQKVSKSPESDKFIQEVESSEDDERNEVPGKSKQEKHQARKEEDCWLNTNVKEAANRGKYDAKGGNPKERKVDSSSDSKDEPEDPLPPKENQGRDRLSRKRVIEESVTDENSPQECQDKDPTVRSKKSRNLQLNRRQIASMQAKTSSLLKKSAANVKFTQESQPSPDQINFADEETQVPGSQELFVEDTKTMEAEPKSADESEYSFGPRNRSVAKGAITVDKFMDVLWPQHIPMKRTQFPKTIALRKTRKNDQIHTFYAPPGKDPISYSKVILQLFNIYFKKLGKEQSKMPSLSWNEPVKAGRHMSRTVDVKGRGQDSYPWSSDNEVDSHSQKSSDDEKGPSLKVTRRRQNLTKTGRFPRNNSNDSNRDSENDFVPDTTRIQPRRAAVTPRKALRQVEDDESLPDIGISSSDNPPEAGQTCYEGETQPMSPVFQSVIPQTLGMDEDTYIGHTENFCPEGMEIQSDDSNHPMEIQPRKIIHKSPVVDNDTIEIDLDKSKGRSPKVRGSRKVRNGSVSPRPSQGSSGSILNSQGELKSFQKVKHGSFNFDLNDEDSKDLDIQNLLKKDVPVSKNNPVELSSSNSEDETSAVDSVHESPVLCTRKSRSTFTKSKAKTSVQDTSEDDLFEVTKKKKVFTMFNRNTDSDEDQKPSTSKNRVIPIIQVDTYERPRATASVKPIPKIRPKALDESEEVPQSKVQQEKEKVECPMCSKMFDAEKIVVHASDCLGQHEVTSTTGDDDVQSLPERPRPGPSSENVNQRRGDNSVQTKLVPVETLIGGSRREAPKQQAKQVEKEMERCCVCEELVPVSEIESHTDQCISAKMEESRHEGMAENERREPRTTRAARREFQAVFYEAPTREVDKPDIESISSDDSVKDPEWTGEEAASSATDPESPLKFKKISQLGSSQLDFQNQFKSKGTKTYKRTAKRGANSRGRGRK